MKEIHRDLVIDEEFRELLPTHSPEEASGLDSQLESDGCEDSVKVWHSHGKKIIVDGMHRYARCLKRGIPFLLEIKEFASREEAKQWMIRRHLGQRNLNETQRAVLLAKLTTNKSGRPKNNPANLPSFSVAEAAAAGNVSERSVTDARKVAERGSAALRQAAAEGKVAVSAAATVSSLPKDEQEELVKQGPKAVAAKAKELKHTPKPGAAKKTTWHDERDFIARVGPLAKRLDEAYELAQTLVDDCLAILKGGDAKGAEKVKAAARYANGQSQKALNDFLAAYRAWRKW